MRNNLIMHFHCSDCGRILNLEYPDNAKEPVRETMDWEPTGAACRYVPKISIKPCRYCIEKYTLPAKALVDAVKAIGEQS